MARYVAPGFPSIYGLWLKSALVDAMVCVVALYWMPLGILAASAVWIVAMALFLVIAGYGPAECKMLMQMLMPRFSAPKHRLQVVASGSNDHAEVSDRGNAA